MFKVLNGKIQLTRGDTAIMNCSVVNQDAEKTEYIMQDGDVLVFTVRSEPKSDSSDGYLIQKTFIDKQIKLVPEDSNSIPYGEYIYDVQLTFANGDINTIIPANIIAICDEVT